MSVAVLALPVAIRLGLLAAVGQLASTLIQAARAFRRRLDLGAVITTKKINLLACAKHDPRVDTRICLWSVLLKLPPNSTADPKRRDRRLEASRRRNLPKTSRGSGMNTYINNNMSNN